jgi:uncharacterized damage-inducible protein DinB
MDNKNHLKFMLERCRHATQALLRDISEEESLFRIDGYPNHIRWEAGHIARGLSQILNCLKDDADFPKRWTELFARGSVLSGDQSVYPLLREIEVKVENLYDKIFNTLETMDERKLEEKIQIFTQWADSRMHGVLFLCMHDFYHGGQIMVIRRSIGKDSVFG